MNARLPAGLVRGIVLVTGLVCCVVAVVALIEGLALAIGGSPAGTWDWVGGAVVIAVVIPLVRPPLERLADRAAYGREGDPYAVLASFVQRISDTLAVDDVLPHLARAAVQATHSSRGGVRLWLADGEERHETWPPEAPETTTEGVSLNLDYDGERVGRIEVAGAADELRDTDRELLARLAGPAGLALSNVRLTLELRRRLAQTMALTESVRRSRERLLHTGFHQRERFVAAVARRVLTRLDAADDQLVATAGGSPTAFGAAEVEALACLEALRDLAAGVFPPVLAERGVAAALEGQLDRTSATVVVHDSVGTGTVRYPPAVESGIYFCCAALVDDLDATGRVSVELGGDDSRLTFLVSGETPPSTAVEQLVRDRVEALGGDLTMSSAAERVDVHGTIPVAGATLPAVIAQADALTSMIARGSESV